MIDEPLLICLTEYDDIIRDGRCWLDMQWQFTTGPAFMLFWEAEVDVALPPLAFKVCRGDQRVSRPDFLSPRVPPLFVKTLLPKYAHVAISAEDAVGPEGALRAGIMQSVALAVLRGPLSEWNKGAARAKA